MIGLIKSWIFQEIKVIPTEPMSKHENTPQIISDVKRVAKYFPELKGKTLILGYVSNGEGRAIKRLMKIGLDPKTKIYSNNLIGHELTHLIQGNNGIPNGEKACDLWTMARHPCLNDKPPHYLFLGWTIRDNWEKYKDLVRQKAIESIERRKTGQRHYIKWFEKEMEKCITSINKPKTIR